MSLIEDLDELMHPFRCKFENQLTPDQWHEWYEWMTNTYGMEGWYIEKNVVCFSKEEDLTLFMLRWF